MAHRRRPWRAGWPLVLVATWWGCAYGFTYGGEGPGPGTARVHVAPLLDRTPEGTAGACVTDHLRRRLGTRVSPGAGPRLVGEVSGVEAGNLPVARPGGVAAGLSVVRLKASVRLEDGAGLVTWTSGERVGSAELVVGPSVSETEDMRRLALERACAAVADELADAFRDR